MKVFIDNTTNRNWTFDSEEKAIVDVETRETLSSLDKLSVRYYYTISDKELDIRIPAQKITMEEQDVSKVFSIFEELFHCFKLEYLGNECGDLRFELIWEDV